MTVAVYVLVVSLTLVFFAFKVLLDIQIQAKKAREKFMEVDE